MHGPETALRVIGKEVGIIFVQFILPSGHHSVADIIDHTVLSLRG